MPRMPRTRAWNSKDSSGEIRGGPDEVSKEVGQETEAQKISDGMELLNPGGPKKNPAEVAGLDPTVKAFG